MRRAFVPLDLVWGDQEDGFEKVSQLPPAVAKKPSPWLAVK
jgi:hypothetical protein